MHKLAALALTVASLTLPAHALAQEAQYDPRIERTVQIQAARFPAPEGCDVVGGWEDASLIAYCPHIDTYITRGPDADDEWDYYDGPLTPQWIDRANALHN